MSDPGCEPIIIDKADIKRYCSYCMSEMSKHNNLFECPICRNIYKEN
tara:strand:+ start:475 stop:615 length:141 start_codon:yes stop_codon:yes gene_type:complete